ncbi:MAG TPA: cytochrome P450 [Jatrophihabitans sp.]|jgi:hypothetical protein
MIFTDSTLAPLGDEVKAFFELDYRLVSDPYPLYARLRQEAPVFWHVDKVLFSHYEDVRALLSSPKVLQGLAVRGTRYRTAAEQAREQERVRLAEMFGFLEKRLGGTNGAHHARLRKLAQRAFTPRMVAQMEQRIVAIADDLIGPVRRDEPVELIDAYAFHLPLIVISEMLDISTEDRDKLRLWANSLGKFVGADWRDADVIAEAHESVFNLRTYLTGVFDERRGGPTTDLLGALIAAEGDGGDKFTEDELVAMITQFVFAGHETSTMFLGNALVALLGKFRDQWDLLCQDDGTLTTAAVDELLRYDSPSHNIDKLAGEDLVIGGVEIAQWDTINLMLASANRDPEVYENPDTIDFTRSGPPHLTFGRGPHHCLGAALARLEAQVSLQMLARRFPQMRLATDTILWRSTHMNRGPEVLPVILGPERAA